jgi:hypothetical protein
VLAGNTLWRLSGTPAFLTAGRLANGSLRLRLDGPSGNPLVVGADAPGFNLTLPGIGSFRTSLGLLPTFFVLADDFGILGAPIPTTGTPWTFTFTPPPIPVGLTVTAEGYVVHPGAANGIVTISNPLTVTF